MSEPKHTPGPWLTDSVVSEAEHDIILGYQVLDAGYPILLATVFRDEDRGPITLSQANANARLIAAAPDLLAACELWDKGFTEGEQFTPEQLLKWMNDNRRAARAAIAKAKGERTDG